MIAKANQFNRPAQGRYVLATLSVEYVGQEEGDPWLDLTPKFAGSDSRQYDTSTCQAVVPQESMDVPTLTGGGTATYQVCYDLPASAIPEATIFVEETISFDEGGRAYWHTK